MKRRKYLIGAVLLLAIALAACQPVAASQNQVTEEELRPAEVMTEDASQMETKQETEGEMMEESTPEEMESEQSEDSSMAEETPMSEKPTEEMTEDKPAEMVETPDWFDIALTNVKTDETFTINDFHGKVILVETLAIWCTNCRQQQNQVIELHTLLGERDDFLSVGLDVDPNENAAQLKEYTANNGYDWTYAVAPIELGRELANRYGSQFLNPSATPMLIIDRQGNVHPLPFGIKSAAQLKEALDPFLQESM